MNYNIYSLIYIENNSILVNLNLHHLELFTSQILNIEKSAHRRLH